jgi:hypothetical protein
VAAHALSAATVRFFTITPLTIANAQKEDSMSRRRLLATAPAALLALSLIGCTRDVPTATPFESATFVRAAPTHGSSVPRPLAGWCETEFTVVSSTPPTVRQIDTGTCQLSHLGRTSFYSDKDINFATGTQISHEAIFTAANGDILRATGSGMSTPAESGRVAFSAILVFAGGTGRFANATGEGQVNGEAHPATRTAFLEIDGWIAYDASDRTRR